MDQSSHSREVKLIAIGNSKGIRIPKAILDKYGWSDRLTMEELDESIVLRGKEKNKLSWEETYRAMAEESEDWSDFEAVADDGLE